MVGRDTVLKNAFLQPPERWSKLKVKSVPRDLAIGLTWVGNGHSKLLWEAMLVVAPASA